MLREPARLAPDVRDEVDAVRVDQYDADAVAAATEDVDALFWVDPTTGSEDPLADYARATGSVVRAVADNRIGRVVFQSSVGAEKRHGAGEIDGLAHTETALDHMGVDVTHLRCGHFFTNLELQLDALRAGTLQVILPFDQPMAWVAPRDIAEVAATRLLSRSVVNGRGDTYKGKRPAKLAKIQTYTLVRRDDGKWRIAAFHNTKRRPLRESLSYRFAPGLVPAAEK
ncbi:NAD(P)H-binding protein [Streptomyces sp. NPDC101150]|uniref:NAD(P)H-binding protein n=1 Tax=Streptomyces sp. NPDC101150 TaxID=3366114 RepID=UPI003822DC51